MDEHQAMDEHSDATLGQEMPHEHPHHHAHEGAASTALSHSLPPDDPTSPSNWPIHRRLYATACGWFFGFGVYVNNHLDPSAY